MQSRRQSLVESLANIAIGYVVALISQIVIFSMMGIYVPLGDNLLIGAYFTAVSLVRSYLVRRWFNRRAHRTR